MVFPTVTEIPLPLQRIEHDAFADQLPLRDVEAPAAEVIPLRQRTPQLRVAA